MGPGSAKARRCRCAYWNRRARLVHHANPRPELGAPTVCGVAIVVRGVGRAVVVRGGLRSLSLGEEPNGTRCLRSLDGSVRSIRSLD